MQASRQSGSKLLQAMRDSFSLPDLRRRILYTLVILAIFRFIAHIPVPNVDLAALRNVFDRNQLLGMLDLFSGGAMRNLSVAAMGVYPYITSSIVMQLLVPVIPALQSLSKEGEEGRNKINQITHWVTVPLAMLQGYGQLILLQNSGVVSGIGLTGEKLLPTTSMVMSMTAGTMFLVWLGERITESGIGNGISILIFGGIVAGLPDMLGRGFIARGQAAGLFFFMLLAAAMVVAIVVFTEGQRRVPVQYSRSAIRYGKIYRQSGSTYIPLRVNMSGMIPLIFAMSIMILPGTLASYFSGGTGFVASVAKWISSVFSATGPIYWSLYFFLVVGFAFFYTMVIFQQMNLAETLQKQGGFVPGIRPGKQTDEYFSRLVTRLTWAGAIFLAVIAIAPFIAMRASNLQVLQLSSAGMIIVVGVVLDTMKQLEAQLLMRKYEGFLK